MSTTAFTEWHERNLRAAEDLAERCKWALLPVYGIREDGSCACGDRECPQPGKHSALSGWQTKATSDQRQILHWFGGEPVRNIGVHLGKSGLIVIDIDGREALKRFKELFPDVSAQLVVRSGREVDGFHLYFSAGSIDLKKCAENGIEFRTGNHYVIVPPSRHVSGREYVWAKGDPVEEAADLAVVPAEIVSWARSLQSSGGKGKTGKAQETTWAPPAPIGEGQGRRNHLVPWAGSFTAKGITDAPLLTDLLGVLSGHYHDPPLESKEIEALAEDAVDRWSAWSEPTPLGVVPTGPPFPVEVLPDWLRAYCEAWAAASQTPVDASAALVLGPLATMAAGRLSVRLLEDWREPAMLHVMLVMESGMKKSPTFKAIFGPVEAAEIMLAEHHRDAHSRALADVALAEKRADAAKRKAATNDGPTRHELEADYHSAVEALNAARDRVKETTPPRLFTDNATPEAIDLMMERHGRITIASAEGDWWSMFAGRYSEKGGLQSDPLTKGWSGERITVDRKASTEAIIIPEARLTIMVANQRVVLDEIERTPGARDRGVLARMLKSAPPTMRGFRNVTDPPPIPPVVRSTYHARMEALLHELFKREPAEVALSPEAAAAFKRLRQRHEAESRPGGRVHDLTAWAEKWPGQVARIALLLHLADADPEDLESAIRRGISLATLESAIAIGDYFTEHEIALAVEMREPEPLKGARALLDWIEKKRPVEVEVREVLRAKSGTVALSTAEKIVAALKYLQDHGYVRPVDVPKGKTAPRWQVNPAAYDPDNIDKPATSARVVDVVNASEGDEIGAAA